MRIGVLAAILSVAIGSAAALLTGLVDVTPPGLLGATWYGYPLSWLRRLILAPEYYPWRVDWPSLVLDLALWSAAAAAVGLSALRLLRGRL